MNLYLSAFADYMALLDQLTKNEHNPRRRAIMENYTLHHAYELSGRWPEIFSTGLAVDEPEYHFKLGTTELIAHVGTEQVNALYVSLNENVMTIQDGDVAVGDWGVASRSTGHIFHSGKDLAAQGMPIDDEDATYVASSRLAMFWPYDENCKMIGEDVYQLTDFEFSKVAPDQVVTMETRNAVAAPYIV